MMSSQLFLVSAFVLQFFLCVEGSYVVWVTHDGPIVQGGSITFRADLFSSDGSRPDGKFRFGWEDNTLQHHTWLDVTTHPSSTWNVTYPSNKFYPGEYEVQVNVDKFEVVFWMDICSRRTSFNITAFLNGEMKLTQNNTSLISPNFVSNATQVQHEIALLEADNNFIMHATEVTTYWFVDCIFYGETRGLAFNYTYGTVGANSSVEALVVASFEPIITTTTTTSTSTTTTTPPPSTTTAVSTTSSTSASTPTSKNAVNAALNSNEVGLGQGQNPKNLSLIKVPYVCLNSSIIPPDRNKTYGYFHHKIYVKAPIQNVSIKGTNWLQQSELLDLQVLCNGSGNFRYCFFRRNADYNVTGNEVCRQETIIETCQFNISKFFSYQNYTVIAIISNDVSKVIYPVKIILYQVQKHAQLSVIVVPVVCSLVTVILIVFGVAYYVQRRKRFTIEVADFDFGQGGGDMEYKTFRERLREAVVNSLNRDFGVDGEGNVWSPSRKYGSMQ